MIDCRRAVIITSALYPTHEQEAIVRRLASGDRLVGPVIERAGYRRSVRPWGFASGVRAHAKAVAALLRRGVLTVHDAPTGTRVATLAEEVLPR